MSKKEETGKASKAASKVKLPPPSKSPPYKITKGAPPPRVKGSSQGARVK